MLSTIPSSFAHASVTPRVLAFYYAWYDQNTWTPTLLSDLPAQTYNSSDPAAIARHIQQAKASGIDAFVVSWTGTDNPTDPNFKTILSLARPVNFAATIDFEVEHFGNIDQVVSALAYVRDNLMTQPAFLRENGRPVIFFWREQNWTVADWGNIRAQVDPDHRQIWIAEGVDIDYQQVFDGNHLYSIAWSTNARLTLEDWAERERRSGADKLWVATVMPGYDDTRTRLPDRFARARDDGSYYSGTWQAAIASKPDIVIINSFNEWVEGTMIEPSVSYGTRYLDLTRELAAQFKSSATARPAGLGNSPNSSSAQPTLQPDQRLTTDILHVREGPGLGYSVLGRLQANRVIHILGRSEDSQWLEIAYPDSDHAGWVSAGFVTPGGALQLFPVVKSKATPAAAPAGTPSLPGPEPARPECACT